MDSSNDLPQGYREELIRAINLFLSNGFNVIPLKPKEKVPLLPSWKNFQQYKFNEKQLVAIAKKKDINLGIVLGESSGNLFVVDFDEEDCYYRFIDEVMPKLVDEGVFPDVVPTRFTWVVSTGKGFHIYLLSDEPVKTQKPCPRIDIRGKGSIIVAPPSIHPSGRRYEPLSGFWIDETPIYKLDTDNINKLISYIRIMCNNTPKTENSRRKGGWRRLDDDTIRQIIDLLLPFYVKGYRNNLLFGLAGYLYKNKVDPDQIKEIVLRLAEAGNDEELEKRRKDIEYQLGRLMSMSDEEIAGISVLEEVMESVDRTVLGMDGALYESTIIELRDLIDKKGIIHKRVIKFKDGEPVKTIIMYPERVIVKYNDNVLLVGMPGVRDARFIELLGMDMEMEKIHIRLGNGKVFSGEIDEAIRRAMTYMGVHPAYKNYVYMMIREIAEREKPIIGYYAPGYWLIGGEPVIVRKSDYLPSWKSDIRWEPILYEEGDDLSRAVKTLKNLIMSYRDPRRPLMILAFAVVSNYAYEIRKRLGYFPNLLVYGSHNTGKGVLADTIRLLFNYKNIDPPPRTPYALQRLVTLSKLPALIEEFPITGERSKAMLDEIHNLATHTRLRTISSKSTQYGGVYENIRALIVMSNDPVLLKPDTVDKLVPLSLDINEGIDEEKAYGYTPNTIGDDEELKRLIGKLGDYMVSVKLVEKIDLIYAGSREEILRQIFNVGIMVIKEAFEDFGETLDVSGVNEVIDEILNIFKDSFYGDYINMFIHEIINSGHIVGLKILEINSEPSDVISKIKKGYTVIINDGEGRIVYISESDRQKLAKHIERVSEFPYYGRRRFAKMDGVSEIIKDGFRYWRIVVG